MASEIKFPAETEANRIAWNHASSQFAGGCVLPAWGPFGECADEDLLGNLDGKNVLEIGCGSGHSLACVARSTAAKIYGLDFSSTAINLAKEINRKELDSGRLTLFEVPMERDIGLRDIDICFSIQAIGWTLDPVAAFANIAGYLRPGGLFVWSWGHPITSKVRYESGRYVVADSYFNDNPRREVGWCGTREAYMLSRPISAWFSLLTGAGFVVGRYLEPQPPKIDSAPADPSRYYAQEKLRLLPSTIVFVCQKPA